MDFDSPIHDVEMKVPVALLLDVLLFLVAFVQTLVPLSTQDEEPREMIPFPPRILVSHSTLLLLLYIQDTDPIHDLTMLVYIANSTERQNKHQNVYWPKYVLNCWKNRSIYIKRLLENPNSVIVTICPHTVTIGSTGVSRQMLHLKNLESHEDERSVGEWVEDEDGADSCCDWDSNGRSGVDWRWDDGLPPSTVLSWLSSGVSVVIERRAWKIDRVEQFTDVDNWYLNGFELTLCWIVADFLNVSSATQMVLGLSIWLSDLYQDLQVGKPAGFWAESRCCKLFQWRLKWVKR